MKSRLLIIGVVAAALVGLWFLSDGVPERRAVATVDPGLDGAVVAAAEGASGSTWFCPTGNSTAAPTHLVFVANPTSEVLHARLVPWSAEGVAGTPVPLDIAASSTSVVTPDQLGGATGSLQVELSPGGGVVSHRLAGGGYYDEGPCASRASAEAHFPAIDTRRGASARLTMFNPFRADTVIDITISSTDAVRVPSQLRSLVIPGGSTRVVELGDVVQRRDLFSASARARSGRFVAELVEVGDGEESPKGLRMQLGMPAPADRLVFADGFVGAGLTERYVVYNPSDGAARVALGAVPSDGDPAAWPEPFLLDVPARRSVVVDLGAEPRVTPETNHWVRLDVLDGSGVVAERLSEVTTTNQAGLQSGTADSTGSPRSARGWIVSGLDTAPSASWLAIVNPSVDSIAVVNLTTFVGGVAAAVPGSTPLEIPPGRQVFIDLLPIAAAAPADATIGVVVEAAQPVVVERRTLTSGLTDLAFVPAFPVAGTLAPLQSFADQLDGTAG